MNRDWKEAFVQDVLISGVMLITVWCLGVYACVQACARVCGFRIRVEHPRQLF